MNRSDGDSYRPRYGAELGPPPPLSAEAQAAMYHFQGNGQGNGYGNQPGGQFDGRARHAAHRPPRAFKFRAPPPSERPLFTQSRLQESSELTFGGVAAEDKFRNLDDLTDTDETDMDVSVDGDYEGTNDIEGPPSKRTRINEQGDAAKSLSKWSNPDPYTALPPLDQDSRKKTNVVHLIRKARNSAANDQKDTPTSHEDDFISFDMDEDESMEMYIPPPDAPVGPRLGRHDIAPSAMSSNLGKRTRDEFENASLVTPKFGQQYHSDGRVLQIWKADADGDATPWVRSVGSSTYSAGVALHKEIVDFYDWVQPRDYEVAVRGSVLSRLEQALLRLHPGGKLEAFGSYAAGLYLPVGDMDLVFLERRFNASATSDGLPPKPRRALFESTAKFIREQRIAKPGSVNAIWYAKVPIIKFIENVSGLKVDLSFNNATGVVANQTFQRWRELYPAMPIITSIIKQFLMIRGLNDVASGGLGGFSIICLVTSLIQHMPQTTQPTNLGQILVEFFNLYGKLFNRQQIAIRLDPPGYLDVASYRPFQFNNDKPDRLKIIDPNRPDNNISGGTIKIGLIFDCFSTAYDILQASLAAHENGHNVPSFLEQIVGGNFEAYDTQREYLRELHIGPHGLQAPAVLLPPPPPIEARTKSNQPVPPRLPPSHQAQVAVRTRSSLPSINSHQVSESTGNGPSQHVETKINSTEVFETTKRLMRLRPALAERARSAATMRELASIGGYSNVSTMLNDLDARDGLSQFPSSKPLAKQSSKENSDHETADPEQEMLEWNLTRVRRFHPEFSSAISHCTSKMQIATACGYVDSSVLFSRLSNWEKENGFQEMIRQQKVVLDAAITKAQVERKANKVRKLQGANSVKEPELVTKKKKKKLRNKNKQATN